MRRILAWVAFGILLAGAVWLPAPQAFAQRQDEAALRQKTQEFARLWERVPQTQDPEERIALADRALKLEPQLSRWPLGVTRERARAVLWSQLGTGYQDLPRGDRAENIEQAIGAYERAQPFFTRQQSAEEWAMVQNNLGIAYARRLHGEFADNQEKAIAYFQAALTVMTRKALPQWWAFIQTHLGIVYRIRIRGEQADNMEKALAAFQAALTVYTHAALPRHWAETQNNLGAAYHWRIRGERADNMEKAIAYYQAALTVRTRTAMPREWADMQYNLGTAYQERIRGERADNMEKAIGAHQAALTVLTREAEPRDWAETQTNLGVAYRDRIRGDRADNMEKALAAFQAALSVRTRQALPSEHLGTGGLLGAVLMETRRWREAGAAYASVRDAFLLLFGQGLNEAEARSLIAAVGPLFSEAAYAAAQLGQNEAALALASEGRARLMAVALRLRRDDRPRVAELRTAIRVAERTADATEGVGKTAAVEKLLSLRQELLALVKSADAAESNSASALAQARALVPEGGAVVVPIVTKVGGKILIVTGSAPASAVAAGLTPIDLPELTSNRLDLLVRGEPAAVKAGGKAGGWLGAYKVNNLAGDELNRRWPEWIAAVDNVGPELWRLVGGRLDAALKEAGVQRGARIVWLPTGALGILPLGLAQDPASKRYLADDYEIVYAPSLDALASAQKQIAAPAPATLAVVINPTGDLAGTEKEGQLVASHFPDTARSVLRREQATPDAVLAALRGRTHWHFASHGSFSWTDARQSGLLMHGYKRLSVGRLIDSDGLGRPRLVVLSACETGLYDIDRNPDEFIGLPGTFTALGAAGVIGTLWPVSDAATALLIARFYELHMGQGTPPPTALRAAQAWLRQATDADLQAYARAAAEQGRLESRHLQELEQELSEDGLRRSRNNALIEWVAPAAGSAAKEKADASALRLARPYAHPYFWAGFIYTGL
jgi:CHAT domain-containing protein/tetratricopeptide (TPR) repeat protein